MSAQLRAAGALGPVARRVTLQAIRPYHSQLPTGGLQRTEHASRALRRSMRFPANSYHNAVIVRNASFIRLLPKLALKFARIPALFGTVMIGGVAWIQYQAIQVSNSAQEVFGNVKNTVSTTASGLWGSAVDIAEQTKRGWDNTKEEFEVPEWLSNLFKSEGGQEGGNNKNNNGSGPGGPEPPLKSRMGAAVGASAAAYGYDDAAEEDDRTPEEISKDDQMMYMTKMMIEIRSLLQKVGQSSTVSLPSIVVIGSQSSGKSSVLEAIVGHEFLPKGNNMITRRPIELTLVNDPKVSADYGEFPDLGLHRITDFSLIQKNLTELNQSVPEHQCVSDDPIRLTIHSPRVPDLSLIDLPGYIQVAGENQPRELKRKISELCDKYIRGPNIILAISAADVDLANSTALQASRRVDPRGERTIGVITKMDLVDPEKGAAILSDKQYPLRLGYVGVISRAPQQTGLFKRDTGALLRQISKNEKSYFSTHPEFGPDSGVSIGTVTLRKKLMHVLEQQMSSKLQDTTAAIQRELEETSYQFKVQYNEEPMTAEAYLAASLDDFKHAFKRFASSFGRPQMQQLLKEALDQRVLDQLAAKYWNKPIEDLSPAPFEPESIADLPKADPNSQFWHMQLDTATSALTRLGVGRLAATVVANAIQANVDKLVNKSTFAKHPSARQVINEAAATVLADRSYTTSDGIEFSLKPYKYEVDIQPQEWSQGRDHVAGVLKMELDQCQRAMNNLENSVGGKRKLKEVMNFVDKARKGEIVVEGETRNGAGGFSAALLQKGREAVFLRDRADIINMRIMAVKSRQCKSLENKYYCPEVFLDAVATKLTQTSVLFLNVEMLNDFYARFPREVESKLGEQMLGGGLERFASEDPRIRRHLDLIRRKELLELVLSKIEGLRRFNRSDDDIDQHNYHGHGHRAYNGNLGKKSSSVSGSGSSMGRFGF